MPYYLGDLGSLILIQILKSPGQPHLCFLFIRESLAIAFYLGHVEMTELSTKLPNIIITFRTHLIVNKKDAIRHAISIILMAIKSLFEATTILHDEIHASV